MVCLALIVITMSVFYELEDLDFLLQLHNVLIRLLFGLCKAPIPRLRGRYGDIHTQAKIRSYMYAMPQYWE